ncbi:MAG: GAF domain-containing protein [Deltaproteobacteria bacterium]|nr:GAF domain-containing protein [Deltaproteobacteria bacterium]
MNDHADTNDLIRERDSLKKLHTDINTKYLEKIEELSLIRRVGDALQDITDFQSVCKSIVSIIQQELDPDNCSLMFVDDERGGLVLRAAKGPYDADARFIDDASSKVRFKSGESIAEHVTRAGSSVLINDVRQDDRFFKCADTEVTIRSLLCIPLVTGERVIAVLNLSHNEPGIFNTERERILAIIANSSATALENTRLYDRLRSARDRLAAENTSLKHELIEKYAPANIIGTSTAFSAILKKVEKLAGVEVNVLITGESGTGKELISRTLHYASPRADQPLVAINCAALPENLLESELFGIEKGVATGVDQRPGKFELADGGTLFLDEVGDMSLATQAKILRILQEQEFQRVGGSKTIKTNVRLISATNKDLLQAIQDGSFREDLFYRLNVVEIQLPPLRRRREDIIPLATFFLKSHCAKHKLGEKWFSREAQHTLENASWSGNVRELENVIEQAAVLSPAETIGPDDLAISRGVDRSQLQVLIPEETTDYKETLRKVTEKTESVLISNALARTGNNRTRAAQLLGISRRSLLYKIDKV